MATDNSFMQYVAEQIDLGGRLSYRKMFGEYAVYLDEKVVALVCDNSLFIKPTPAQSCTRWPTSYWTMPTRCAAW